MSARLAFLLAFLGVAACAPQPKIEVETFRKPAVSRVDDAYLQAGADFSVYRRLQVYPLEIYFYKGMGQPDPAVAERIRQIFSDAFLAALGSKYPISETPGPEVLQVRASLVDLKHSDSLGALPVRGRAAQLVANGQLTFFMELRDSMSGVVLARAADREKAPADTETMSLPDAWAETEVAARRWAGMFRNFLDENLQP